MKENLLLVDLNIYGVETVKRVLYKFSDQFAPELSQQENLLSIYLIPKDNDKFNFEDIKKQLLDEFLDQDLRTRIALETENIRNVIIAKAFANADIQ
jgi:His-Xaa-Ser system protein HxsD